MRETVAARWAQIRPTPPPQTPSLEATPELAVGSSPLELATVVPRLLGPPPPKQSARRRATLPLLAPRICRLSARRGSSGSPTLPSAFDGSGAGTTASADGGSGQGWPGFVGLGALGFGELRSRPAWSDPGAFLGWSKFLHR
jgi:hypothetical protein